MYTMPANNPTCCSRDDGDGFAGKASRLRESSAELAAGKALVLLPRIWTTLRHSFE